MGCVCDGKTWKRICWRRWLRFCVGKTWRYSRSEATGRPAKPPAAPTAVAHSIRAWQERGVHVPKPSRWERWSRRPYQVVGWLCFLISIGCRFVPVKSEPLGALLSVVSLVLVIIAVVLIIGPRWHRHNVAMQEEVRRNPTGRNPIPLEQRLAAIDHRRRRWLFSAAVAAALAVGTVAMIYLAIAEHDRSFVGLAILFAIPAVVSSWVTWLTRAALRHRD